MWIGDFDTYLNIPMNINLLAPYMNLNMDHISMNTVKLVWVTISMEYLTNLSINVDWKKRQQR